MATFSQAVCDDKIPAIRVGVYENIPKIFTNEEGIVTGFWPDLIKYISAQENWQIKWVSGTWAQCLERLKTGEINILPDTGWTEPRSREYAFSNEPVLGSWSRLYVTKNSKINSIIDLNGKTIAGLKGSCNLEGPEGLRQILYKFNLDATIKEMEIYEQVFEALQEGKIDAGITNKDFGNLHESDYAIERTSIIFQPARLQFAFTRNADMTPFLIERIDAHMKRLKGDENSIYYQALDQYIGGKPVETFIKIIPEWIKMIFAVGCGVILFLAAVGIASRIQVRRRTFELQKSEEKYRTLADECPISIMSFNHKGIVTFVNKWHLKTFAKLKHGPEFFKGKKITELPGLARTKVISDLGKVLEGKSVFLEDVYFPEFTGGHSGYQNIKAVPVYKEGKIVGGILIREDITKRKKLEAQLQQAQKMEAIGTLAGGIAHDFNNILFPIIGYADMLLMEISEDSPFRDSLNKINTSALRAKDLVRQILSFARQEPNEPILMKLSGPGQNESY